jgi:hypothetical protein
MANTVNSSNIKTYTLIGAGLFLAASAMYLLSQTEENDAEVSVIDGENAGNPETTIKVRDMMHEMYIA